MLKEERKRRRNAEQIRTAARLVLAAVIVVCLIYIAVYYIRGMHGQTVYGRLQQESAVLTEETEQIEAKIYAVPDVDFEKLWETNTDICAWIYIPGTEVNYPVLQRKDSEDPTDDYYLNHMADGTSGLPASIYIEPGNASDFSDYNTVVYGHHMKNGTMFGSLDDYQNEAYMWEHPYVYVITPEKELVYQVFGAVSHDDSHIMLTYDFTSEEGRQQYLDALTAGGDAADVLRGDVGVTAEDRLLTLSTCIKNENDKRLLVEAVLIDEMEK